MRTLHVILAVFVALWAQMRWELDWWCFGIAAALFGVLEGSVRVRWLAPVAWVIGTTFTAMLGASLCGGIALRIHPTRAAVLPAGLFGLFAGGALAVVLYRKNRRYKSEV
jgi:hypothetical protein